MEKKKNLKVVELELDGDNLEEELEEALNVIRDEILESIGEDIPDELLKEYKVFRSWKKEFTAHDISVAFQHAIEGTPFEHGILKEGIGYLLMDVFGELFPMEEFEEFKKSTQKEEE